MESKPQRFCANCAEETRYVLETWKSIQVQLDLESLLNEFDQKLSGEMLAKELRTTVATHFYKDKKEMVIDILITF